MIRSVLPALLVLSACGDNGGSTPDGSPGDAGTATRAVIVTGNFMPGQTGVMSALSFDPLAVTQRVAPNGAVAEDPIVRKVGGELFVVNRASGNNVTILDAATFAVIEQLPTGAGANPQDVAVVGDKLFVPAFNTAGVVVITRGTGARTTVDLGVLDPDGQPNCVSAYAVGTEVYVACELLDPAFTPRGPGRIAVLDGATAALKTTFALANANPFGAFERMPDGVLGGDLVIPTVPSFFDFSVGCVERVQTGAAPKANGCVVANQEVGGYVSRIDVAGGIQWMVVSSFDTQARGSVQGYDLTTSMLWPIAVTPASQVIVDLATCPNGKLVVADQTMEANGLRVFASTVEETTAPLPIGLRPASSRGLVCY